MFNDPFHPEEALKQHKDSRKRKLLAVICAVAITAVLLVGYTIVRKRHAKPFEDESLVLSYVQPHGPALAHVVVDEPTLENGMTTVGGAVKNISGQHLSGLVITLEFRRRKDGKYEETVLPVSPAHLQPQEEGAFAAKFSNDDFASVRLVGVRADPESTFIAYSSSQGKKRPPQRLPPQTIVVKRAGKPGEFINTPDNPGRIP
jgi:hypothetical protein